MAPRYRLEGTPFQPKAITQVRRGLCKEFLGIVSLGMQCLVTYGAAFFAALANGVRRISEERSRPGGPGNYLDMHCVGKRDLKIRLRSFRLCRTIEGFRRIREGMPSAVPRRRIDVADGTDRGPGPLEKLLPMTRQARLMLGVFGDVRESVGLGSDLVPVGRGELVTGRAFLPMCRNVMPEITKSCSSTVWHLPHLGAG